MQHQLRNYLFYKTTIVVSKKPNQVITKVEIALVNDRKNDIPQTGKNVFR